MAAAALLSITLVPALMVLFVRGRILPEHSNPLNRAADLALPAGHPAGAARQDCSPSLLAVAVLAATAMAGDAARQPSSCRPSTRARCSTCR